MVKSPLSDEELPVIIEEQLPGLLQRHPDIQERLYKAFLRWIPRREEVAEVVAELRLKRNKRDEGR